MTRIDSADQDARDAEAALTALSAAQSRAVASGGRVVVVREGRLIEISRSGEKFLRTVGPRRQVTQRIKRSRR